MSNVPEKPTSEAIVGTTDQNAVPSTPYSSLKREISEEDLDSPVVQRILLGEVDKLESKVSNLESYVEKFHATDKKAAVLEEKLKTVNADEVLYSFCLTIGSVIIGLSSILQEHGYGKIAIVVGTALLIGAIASKVIKWRS